MLSASHFMTSDSTRLNKWLPKLKKKKLDLGLDQGCQKYLDGLRNLMRKISNKCKFQKIHRISKKELFICSMSTLFCAQKNC